MAEPADRLAGVPIFRGQGRAVLEDIAGKGKDLSFEAGQEIVGEGGRGWGSTSSSRGRRRSGRGDRVLGQLGEGQFFGEASLVEGRGRPTWRR